MHHGWRKFYDLLFWNGWNCTLIIRHGWIKFGDLLFWNGWKCTLIIHHDWRKFCDLLFWNGWKCTLIIHHGWTKFYDLLFWNSWKCALIIHHDWPRKHNSEGDAPRCCTPDAAKSARGLQTFCVVHADNLACRMHAREKYSANLPPFPNWLSACPGESSKCHWVNTVVSEKLQLRGLISFTTGHLDGAFHWS